MQPAHLTDGIPAPQGGAAAPRQALVQRINALSSMCIAETNRAFHLGEGREADVVRLMMVDAGVHARSPETDALRKELGLPDPVIPSLNELGDLTRTLYVAREVHATPATALKGGEQLSALEAGTRLARSLGAPPPGYVQPKSHPAPEDSAPARPAAASPELSAARSPAGPHQRSPRDGGAR